MDDQNQLFMARALELASGPAFTSPNPRVGAVIVRDGRIVGEGAHRGAGQPHAEVVALQAADARGATLYVSLEPCNHEGRTPPCVPAIVAAGIARVVAPAIDPDELVAGTGFTALRGAGIEVDVGTLAGEAEAVNAPYLHHRRTGDSFITLKLALSLDGRLAAPDRSARWITGPGARRRVHRRRQESDALMVGVSTILTDDPELTVRDVVALRQPLRVVLDSSGRVPADARVFSADGGAVIVATTDRSPDRARWSWEARGAEVLVLPPGLGGVDLHALVKELGARDVVEILCEGGAEVATSLLGARLVGRLELHYGPKLLGTRSVGLGDLGVTTMGDAPQWRLETVERSDDDFIAVLRPREGTL